MTFASLSFISVMQFKRWRSIFVILNVHLTCERIIGLVDVNVYTIRYCMSVFRQENFTALGFGDNIDTTVFKNENDTFISSTVFTQWIRMM